MVLDCVGLTGATGMLGRHLVAYLKSNGIKLVKVSRASSRGVSSWNLANWLSFDELDSLFPQINAIVHCGAMVNTDLSVDEGIMFNANVRSTLNIGNWALARNLPMVYISGAIVYKNPYALRQDESSKTGWSGLGGFYGLTKLLAEDTVSRLRQKGLNVAILRPTSIYGFGLPKDKLVNRFLVKANSNDILEINEPINDGFDLIHASDVASLTLAVLKSRCWKTLNAASSATVTLRELAEACVSITSGGKVSVKGKSLSNKRPQVMYSLDNSRAYKHLNWSPRIGIYEGLNMLDSGKLLPKD